MTIEKKKNDSKLLDRREALTALGAMAPLVLMACSSTGGTSSEVGDDAGAGADGATTTGDAAADAASAADSSSASDTSTGTCVEIPDETGGPYPDADGMISNTTYQRVDITEGLAGTPLTLSLQVLDVSNGCAAVVGARVIIWHCDANGVYSEYANAMNTDTAQNDVGSTTTTYLRGWQVTDSTGTVKFTTIYPGWYSPRVTHIHVMVYDPSDLTTPVKTTQFAFPDSANATVYAQSATYPKGQNSVTNSTDMVFGGSTENLVAAITRRARGARPRTVTQVE
jgi:protocatechuate 3,4-dioxygenase beta subunit